MSNKINATSAQDGERVIKKYPNRRLYDTATSSYVALADIKLLVMAGEPLVVRDAKTGEDLTRSILLQIILEQEAEGVPILTERMLANVIRFYGSTLQGFMGPYLEKNVQAFMDIQSQLADRSKDLTSLPLMPSVMGSYAEQSTNAFMDLQEQMQKHMQKQTEQMLEVMGVKRR
ncbi:polyhydroxyalkanoate synthesis repressor PhaR [Limnohabitans sp. B9-3]|uniref:polyhydroxyalkanoate synthesis repressor PhaR n=1 Tax=Limnohabitans sp. B9-3 TaxID=1100707 RepID=UPI000C1DDE82|nr:polyhydroxyalkanoate synthesis repressor PhaR [Limnohabitans sp. B9-3]PIT77584.1 polyhydroxyalkanoate synthesis repressor PhaR [Limnohabitans sp. B9-3]